MLSYIAPVQESQRIDHLLAQWADERPDVDTGSMALVARLQRVVQLIDLRLDALAAEFGVHRGEGDVLFALRRAGAPYRLSPSRLAESLLVTTGTMTNRLDRLERRGYIRRIPNPEDRRGILVELTEEARGLTDTALERHVGNQREMLAVLSMPDRQELTRLLNTLIDHLAGS